MFIEAKDDGGGGDNWATGAISRAKLQSNHHHQKPTPSFFFRHALPVAKALKGKYNIPGTCLPQTHLGSSNFVFDH